MLFVLCKKLLESSRTISRTATAIFAGALLLAGSAAAAERSTWTIQAPFKVDACTTYRAILEVDGNVKWRAQGKDNQQAPLRIRGDLTYDERILSADPEAGRFRAARYYRQAQVKYQLGKQVNERQLGSDQRLMIAALSDSKVSIGSPYEPLSQDELDLVDVPGCTLALPLLLPASEVGAGDKWEADSQALAPLLGITSVTSSDVRCTLARVENEVAYITFAGEVIGRADGARTQMDVEGKLNVDLAKSAIVWLAMSITEQRDVSETQPGLEVTARLRLAAKPATDPIAELADESLPELLKQQESFNELVRIVSTAGGFQLLADRHWRVIFDRPDGMILRYFEDDQLIAQAIITPLPDGPPGKHLTMAALEEDVQQTLQQHAGQVVERAEGSAENGVRVLRISAAGVVSDVSMQWVFYHVSRDDGRRTGLTFTIQTDLLEKFAQRDQAMVETFEFTGAAATQEVSVSGEQQ